MGHGVGSVVEAMNVSSRRSSPLYERHERRNVNGGWLGTRARASGKH